MFIIIKARRRLKYLLQLMMALAILFILTAQLLGLIKEAAEYYQRWQNRNNPHGNPIKVHSEYTPPVPICVAARPNQSSPGFPGKSGE